MLRVLMRHVSAAQIAGGTRNCLRVSRSTGAGVGDSLGLSDGLSVGDAMSVNYLFGREKEKKEKKRDSTSIINLGGSRRFSRVLSRGKSRTLTRAFSGTLSWRIGISSSVTTGRGFSRRLTRRATFSVYTPVKGTQNEQERRRERERENSTKTDKISDGRNQP